MTEKELIQYLEISNYQNIIPLCKMESNCIKILLSIKHQFMYDSIREECKKLFPEIYNNYMMNRFEYLFDLDTQQLHERLSYNIGFMKNNIYEYQKVINGFIVGFTKKTNSDDIEIGFYGSNIYNFKPIIKTLNLKRFNINKIKKVGEVYITDLDEYIQDVIDEYFFNLKDGLQKAFVYRVPIAQRN